jgi:hypothetical protein
LCLLLSAPLLLQGRVLPFLLLLLLQRRHRSWELACGSSSRRVILTSRQRRATSLRVGLSTATLER